MKPPPRPTSSALVQGFFNRPAAAASRRASAPHHRRVSRHLPSPPAFCRRAIGEGAIEVDARRAGSLPSSATSSITSRRNAATSARSRNTLAGGNPRLLPLRLVPGAGTRRAVPPCPGHPQQSRYERRLIEYLSKEEIDALVAAPDKTIWRGRRDQALLLVAIQTGLRVSELTGLQRKDVALGTGAQLRCEGKGGSNDVRRCVRKQLAVLAKWLDECPPSRQRRSSPAAAEGH